jgi:hypothetical protein
MELIMMCHGEDITYPDADATTEALDSLNEDHWFKQMKADDPERRKKLVDAIKKHHVLRFVGGNPLPPDLDLDAGSVIQVISTLGTNVSLATIDLHGFEAEFLNENEVKHVLVTCAIFLNTDRSVAKSSAYCGNATAPILRHTVTISTGRPYPVLQSRIPQHYGHVYSLCGHMDAKFL